jgi:hypothetical protein
MRKWVHLIVPLLAGALAVIALLVWNNRYFDAVVAVGLLFLIPGWIVTRWSRHSGFQLDPGQRAYWTVIVSVGSVIVSGVILNYVADLTRKSWLVWELGLTAVVAVIDIVISLRAPPSDASRERQRTSGWLTAKPLLPALLITASLAMLVGAIWLSEISSSRDSRERVVQMYIVPEPVLQGSYASKCELGVTNETGAAATLDIRLYRGVVHSSVETWTLHLGKGAHWTRSISRSDKDRLVATVAYKAHPGTPLATVSLGTPTNG